MMSDLISREAALKKISQMSAGSMEYAASLRKPTYGDGIEYARKVLNEAESVFVPEAELWNDASKELPCDNRPVLCFCRAKNGTTAMRVGWYLHDGDYPRWIIAGNVTHWMDLPEGPKDVSQ